MKPFLNNKVLSLSLIALAVTLTLKYDLDSVQTLFLAFCVAIIGLIANDFEV